MPGQIHEALQKTRCMSGLEESVVLLLLISVCLCVCAAPANGHAEPLSLYEAESWAAIGAFLFGPDPSKALTPHPSTQEGTNAVKVRAFSTHLSMHSQSLAGSSQRMGCPYNPATA